MACSAVTLVALRTICSASAGLRPWLEASARTNAAASFSTLRPSAPPMSLPFELIGVAAPMLVCGAIAATSAASVMNTPAEPARAPFGETYTTTGIGAPSIFLIILRIDSSSPPGVSSRKITR